MFQDSLSLFSLLSSASFVVKLVFFVLLAFSLISWAIILVKFFELKRDQAGLAEFQTLFWKSSSFSDVYSKIKLINENSATRLFMAAYRELKNIEKQGFDLKRPGLDILKRSLDRNCKAEVTRMTQLVPFLASCGNTAPFIGLFGTVWGIMDAFHGIGVKGSANLAVVAPGISEALVATAMGLAVAIPAVVAYNSFLHKIRTISSELENFSLDFLNITEVGSHNDKGDF